VTQQVWASEKIWDQLGKLVGLAPKVCSKSSLFPRGEMRGQKPEYSLMAHMTWDENGELRID
jgi:hypothetical protein